MTRPLAIRAALGAMCCLIGVQTGCRGGGAKADGGAAAAPAAGHTGSDSAAAAHDDSVADASSAADGAVPPVVGAHTVVVAQQPFTESVIAMGVVAPRPGHFAELAPPAPARVAHIYVAAGDRVTAGTPLVDFERGPFDAAAASAAAALTMAQHAYDRAQRLSDAGIVARKEVDQAATDLAVAQSADVSAQRAQQLATVRAPISGVVTHLSAVLGATADPAQAVVGVADPDALDLVFSLSPVEAERVHPGAIVALTTGQQASGEPLGQAEVTTLGAALDSATRTVAVRARFTHPTRTLRIGETVFGRIDLSVHAHATTVPVQALVPDGDGLKVFVVGADGLAHARAVVVGGRTETTAEILDGVRPGETVVTEGAYGVEDRAKVVPVR
jgi:RND family efflux transporter MFP subunit